MTSRPIRSAISSQAAVSGPSPRDLPDGMTLDLFGPALAPASPIQRPGKEAVTMIQGISGRTFIASSVPEGPLSSWESKLRERLGMVGSTESALIWRLKTTPAGRSISRLAPSTLHTNGTASIGSAWPTPSVANATGGQSSRSGDRKEEMLLSGLMREADKSQWSTPRASDGEKGAPRQTFSGGGQPLPAQIYGADRANWVTPSARDWKDTPGMATTAGDRNRIDQLPRQMAQEPQASWPTPTSLSFKDSHQPGNGRSMNKMLELAEGTALTGPMPNGSSVTTAKRGAPNPVFAFWLMGFPDEWTSGALEAMRLFRLKRPKSSRH